MKRHIALMATALLLCGGSYAQNTQPEKKPKAYVVADAHLDIQQGSIKLQCPVIVAEHVVTVRRLIILERCFVGSPSGKE